MGWILLLNIITIVAEVLFLILLCTSKYGDTIILTIEDLFKEGADILWQRKNQI